MTSPPEAKPIHILLATKGHAFQKGPFFGMFDSFASEGIINTSVEQPAAMTFFSREHARPYDVIVDYSMAGVFDRPGGPAPGMPPEDFARNYLELLEDGTHGFVMIHHNLCSWSSWGTYAEIVGGRFFFDPGELRGEQWPDSGYLLAAEHKMSKVNPDHPVVQGVDDDFMMQDEIYLCPIFEDDVEVLMRSDFDFRDKNFFSPALAVRGRMYDRGEWHHPAASNAVVWAKHYGNSPIVYIEPGDVPTSYNNPNYQRLIKNAIKWVASDEAKAWARERNISKPKHSVPTLPFPGTNRVPEKWKARVNPAKPEKGCLFCEKDGVERYGGLCDMHTVSNGDSEVRGPICGNCHIAILDLSRDTGGWRLVAK